MILFYHQVLSSYYYYYYYYYTPVKLSHWLINVCVCVCVPQKCMWGISQVKPSQAKSSQAKLLFVSRKISPTVAVKLQRESMSE